MRISPHEQRAIVQSVQRFDPHAEIWLIGSRADDQFAGGDIDLLIISEKIDFRTKIDLLVDLKLALGDQRIDSTIVSPTVKDTDPFVVAALSKASVRLDSGD